MKTLNEAYSGWGYKAKLRDGDFGMEIETEVKDNRAYPDDFLIMDGHDDKGVAKYKTPLLPKWRAVGDGSLRNFGIEYIYKEPYSFKEASEAIDIFGEATKKVKFIENAPGTSVHVHTNMWDKTFLTFGNYCTLHMLFENVLIEFAGETRRSNLFSLPTRCAEPTGWNIIRMFEGIEKGDRTSIRFNDEAVKYAAFNLASLTRLGSVENRMMRGVTDPKTLKRWLSILNNLLVFSKTDGLTPRDIINEYRVKGVDFFEEVFGKEAIFLAVAAQDNIESLIDKNLYFAGSIASSVKNWNTLGDALETRNPDEDVFGPKKKVLKKVVGDFINPVAGDVHAGQANVHLQAMANQMPADFWAQPLQQNPIPAAPPNWHVIDEAADFPPEFNEEF